MRSRRASLFMRGRHFITALLASALVSCASSPEKLWDSSPTVEAKLLSGNSLEGPKICDDCEPSNPLMISGLADLCSSKGGEWIPFYDDPDRQDSYCIMP